MVNINIWQLNGGVVKRFKQCPSLNDRSLEGEVCHNLKCDNYDMAAKRASFLAATDRLRRKTEEPKR